VKHPLYVDGSYNRIFNWVVTILDGKLIFGNTFLLILSATSSFRRNENARRLAKDFLLDLQSGTLDLYVLAFSHNLFLTALPQILFVS